MPTPRANFAILRRLFLITGVVLGITFTFWQRAQLYRVNVEDFIRRQKNEYAWTGRRQLSLQEYINYKTEDHLLHKQGQAWIDLYNQVAQHGDYSFFLTDRAPLNELANDIVDKYSFTYVALEHEGKTAYLNVDLSVPGDSPDPPTHLRYPMRRFALFVFLAGLLSYILVPWPKRNPDTVAYARFIGALLPDMGLGMLFIGAFFTLPWLFVPTEAGTSHPLVFDGGWIILTLIMWSFCLFGLAIHIVAAWYEVRCIHIADDHLIIESLLKAERVHFTDIECLTLGNRQPPKLLVKAGFLLSLVNWRAAGPTLLVATRDDPLLCILMRDGRKKSFSLTALYNLERLIAKLKEAGIKVDPDLDPTED